MSLLETTTITCPYCGERIELEIDCSAGDQSYVEDCSVCCRPIEVEIRIGDDGRANVDVRHENE